MSRPKDGKPFVVGSTSSDSDDSEATDDHLPAGRIVHDERGNALWKWAGDGDTSSTDSTSSILKYIEPADLHVEGQSENFSKPSDQPAGVRDAGGGYDPYNQGGAAHKTRPPGKARGGKG